MNNLIWIILDSCRYDNFTAANVKYFTRIADVDKRYSYASWTSPSHYTFLMGLMPHNSPVGVFASEVYREDFKKWNKRIGIEKLSFENLIPELNLVKKLNDLGYRTIGKVSLPVLNNKTTISTYFQDYKLMDDHNSFEKMVNEITFQENLPSFYFLNIGETHYPYMLKNEELLHISGVHGVLKHLDDLIIDEIDKEKYNSDNFFTHPEMQRLKMQQIKAIEYCDNVFNRLLEKCPKNTYFIITADHGELFGEQGYFGHGPIMHKKVFEVPFIEGQIKR